MSKNTLPRARRDLRAEIKEFELVVRKQIYDEVIYLTARYHDHFKSQKSYESFYKELWHIIKETT